MPSPLHGLTSVYSAGRTLMKNYREDDYINAVQAAIDKRRLNWVFERDNTESNPEELMAKGAVLLVCTPGLRFRFYRGCYNKNQVVYLSTMEYATNDVRPVMRKLRELEDAEQN